MFLTEEEFVNNTETKNFSQNVSLSYHLEDRNKNVPKLRFKGYNDEWKKIKLGEHLNICRGASPRPIEKYITVENNGVNWIKIGDISPKENVIKSTKEKITIDGAKHSRYVRKGDLILSNSMSFGRPYILEIDGCIHDGWLLIQDLEKLFDKKYLCYLLDSDTVKLQYRKYAAGGVVINLNSELVRSVSVFIPTLPEQEKIASFLTLVDKKIEKQKELVELLKKYKRGLLSAMFSQKLRFKDDKGNDYPTWEEKRLEEILKIKHGKSQKEIECTNGKYPILATGGEIGRTNSCLWNKPCVLIGRKGTIDKPQYMETPFWTVDTLFYSEVFKDNNAKYLYYLFNTINWKKYDESTGVPSLSAKTIERIKVTLSISYTEQTIISKNLSKFDDKIQQEECLLNYLQTYKKGLLQQMFI